MQQFFALKNMHNKRSEKTLHHLEEAKWMLENAKSRWLKARGAMGWTIVVIILILIEIRNFDSAFWVLVNVSLGIYFAYVLLFDWQKIQKFELEIMDRLNSCWKSIKLTQYPIKIHKVVKERNPVIHFFFVVMTLGFFGLYWDYCIHHDPEHLFRESEMWEDSIVSMFRNAKYQPTLREESRQTV